MARRRLGIDGRSISSNSTELPATELVPIGEGAFLEAHRRLGASSLVDGDEDGLYKIAQWIDVWVQEPTHWYDSPNVTEPQILNYYVSALNALALLGSMATRANVPAILPMPKEQE